MGVVERRLAAILAADVVGYSRLMSSDEDGTLRRVKALFGDTVRPKIVEYRGRLVKTNGDGFLAEFGSVFDALNCAVDVQAGVSKDQETPHTPLQMRMGINIGEIIFDEGDVFGDGVNIAARLEALAQPGAICVSQRAWDDLRKLDYQFDDLGDQKLKNMPHPVRVYSLAPRTLGRSSGRRPKMPRLGPRAMGAVLIIVAVVGALVVWLSREDPIQKIERHLATIPCSWVRVAENAAQDGHYQVKLVGVSLTPPSVLQSDLDNWAKDQSINLTRLVVDTAPMEPSQCLWLESIKQFKYEGLPRISLGAVHPYQFDKRSHHEGTVSHLYISLGSLRKYFVLYGIEPSGKASVVGDEKILRSSEHVKLQDGGAELLVMSDHQGGSGLILIDSNLPIPSDMLTTPHSAAAVEAEADKGQWKSELVWYYSVKEPQSVDAPAVAGKN